MLQIYGQRVEYKTNPVGMDELSPRFSYKLCGDSKRQTQRRIVVKNEKGNIFWDSGFVVDSRTTQIPYKGRAFTPFTRYEWFVTVRDENGKDFSERKESEPIPFFETGFLGVPWKGAWIMGGYTPDALRTVRFFKDIHIGKELLKARLCVTALGLYECFFDGKEITDTCFNPGWTDYFTRVQYQVFDVTGFLSTGEHRMAVYLAPGWYCGRIARNWNKDQSMLGNHPAFRCELQLEYADGTQETVASDKSFQTLMTECGVKIGMSDIYMGEIARWADESWMHSGYNVPGTNSLEINPPVRIAWHSGAPVRRMGKVNPVKIIHRKNGTWIIDFGQNLTGRERLSLRNTQSGATIVIKHGEMLNEDGSLYTENLRTALATTLYTCGTNAEEIYEPHFTFFGFRYLEISGWPGELTAEMICVYVIHSEIETTGTFVCSDPLINQLYSNIVWGQKSNFLDVPTDCPQRDERFGWTADTQVFTNTATFNTYAPAFYTKWIEDLNLCQYDNGAYPSISPDPFRKDPSPVIAPVPATGWGDAGLICPDILYRKYGDTRIMKRYFDNMKHYLDMQIELAGGSLLVDNAAYGDWLNLDAPTPGKFISTCYLAGMSALLAKMADIIGRAGEAALLRKRVEAIKELIGHEFFSPDGMLKVRTQTAALMILHWDLAPSEETAAKTASFLVEDITVTRKLHLSTGFLGTPLLLKVLVKIGQVDLAYDLLRQTSYPSWLYPVTQGATTMWERWNSWNDETGFGDVSMNSFNHYAYGAVGEWFFEGICGIESSADSPDNTGFRHFRLSPQFGHSLTHASAEYESDSGLIRSTWQRTSPERVIWNFTVPCNSTALVTVPGEILSTLPSPLVGSGNATFLAEPGDYQVEIKY